MSDEVRKQILKDANEWGANRAQCEDYDANQDSFVQGATHQHPIGVKEGYNQALADVSEHLDGITTFFVKEDQFIRHLKQLLDKLKKG